MTTSNSSPQSPGGKNLPAKLALLVNTISPARVPLFVGLARHFDLLLLHGGTESNRDTWQDADRMIPGATVLKAWGWQIRLSRRMHGREFDCRYFHVTPGYVWHLSRFRPNVVVSNEMGLRSAIALVYGTLFRKPVWIWWGGTIHTEREVSRTKRAVRWLFSRWAKRWISYGQSSTEYLLQLGISRDHTLEIQNSVDEQRFTVDSPSSKLYSPRPVLLYVGQFTRRKGIENLLGAALAIQREGKQFSLVLVGSGPEKAATRQLVQALGLRDVYFEPAQTPAQMPSVYRSADLLIFPTLEDVWGLVANEAMLCGLPVLCSKYAGCASELFEAECLFDPLNANEFATKLRGAIAGRLPPPDVSRLRSTSQLLSSIVSALSQSIAKPEAGPLAPATPSLPKGL